MSGSAVSTVSAVFGQKSRAIKDAPSSFGFGCRLGPHASPIVPSPAQDLHGCASLGSWPERAVGAQDRARTRVYPSRPPVRSPRLRSTREDPMFQASTLHLHHLELDGTLRVSGIPKRPDGAQPAALLQHTENRFFRSLQVLAAPRPDPTQIRPAAASYTSTKIAHPADDRGRILRQIHEHRPFMPAAT